MENIVNLVAFFTVSHFKKRHRGFIHVLSSWVGRVLSPFHRKWITSIILHNGHLEDCSRANEALVGVASVMVAKSMRFLHNICRYMLE